MQNLITSPPKGIAEKYSLQNIYIAAYESQVQSIFFFFLLKIYHTSMTKHVIEGNNSEARAQ